MNTSQLQKSLEDLRREQSRLTDAIRTLEQLLGEAKPNRLSAEGRARISEAARKRWEEHRRRAAQLRAGRSRRGQIAA